MLPNHSPLVIAEQFGTLASLYPGRIDLGLGRAPGSDHQTMRALRRGPEQAENFPQDVVELQALLGPLRPGQVLTIVTGRNIAVATSGNAERGAHIRNPVTGQPATGLASVTVTGPSLTRADGYATAICARERPGLVMPGYETLAVSPDGACWRSPGFPGS